MSDEFGQDDYEDPRPSRPAHQRRRSDSHDGGYDQPRRVHNRQQPRTHFVVNPRVHVELDYDFAIALGEFLLGADLIDKRFKSFGHNLCNLENNQDG